MALIITDEIQELFVSAEGSQSSRALEDWLADSSHGGSIVNNRPQYMRKWRAALAKARAGTANAKVACIGDSTTAGYSGVTNTSVRSKSWPAQMANFLAGRGIPTGQQSLWGDNKLPGGIYANDSRVTGSGWVFGGLSAPGNGLYSNGTATFAFTPTVPVDTFDIYYLQNGVFSAAIDGAAATNSVGGGLTINKMTLTAALGTHTLNVAWVSGSNTFIIGVDAYNSASKQVSVWNWGNYGSTSSNWNPAGTAAWDPVRIIPNNLQPDLTFICLGINDIGNSVPLATTQANIQALITACQQTGDVVLIAPVPGQIAGGRTQQVLDSLAQMLASLALANGCALIDLNARWESYTVSNGLGFMADNLHPTSVGYCDKAQAVASVLSSV